jgi:hypothetical protein
MEGAPRATVRIAIVGPADSGRATLAHMIRLLCDVHEIPVAGVLAAPIESEELGRRIEALRRGATVEFAEIMAPFEPAAARSLCPGDVALCDNPACRKGGCQGRIR